MIKPALTSYGFTREHVEAIRSLAKTVYHDYKMWKNDRLTDEEYGGTEVTCARELADLVEALLLPEDQAVAPKDCFVTQEDVELLRRSVAVSRCGPAGIGEATDVTGTVRLREMADRIEAHLLRGPDNE